jgi:chromosome partitioning protein
VLVLNRVPTASRLREAVEADIAKRNMPMLGQALGNRTAYATAFADGLGVTEAAARSVAADELRSLVALIRKATE